MKLYEQSATKLSALLQAGEITSVELTKATLARIAQTEPQVDAFLHIDEEGALQAAAQADKRLQAKEKVTPLTGVPVGIKDNICTENVPTTCASRMLGTFRPPYDATVVGKLRQAGAVMPGKLNMDEFAMGSSCENSYFKPTKNPWNPLHVPGGSSGGSAAAVAAQQVPLSLGSDTGGSIRTPAAFCGILGLKPTYGAVSRFGLIAFASSLDQIGPFARTVDDLALLYGIIVGQDAAHDATSKPTQFTAPKANAVQGLRVGIPSEYYAKGLQPEVAKALEAAAQQLVQQGAQLVDISLPSTDYALSAYYIISSAEASSNLARYDGVKYGFSAGRGGSLEDLYLATRSEGFGPEVQRRILLGTHVLSSGYYDAYYKRAKLLQRQIVAEFSAAFAGCDVLLTPTTPTTAFEIGEKTSDPVAMYAADVCTVTVNIAGLPALSVPCGFDSADMPIGMQLIGPKFSEEMLLGVAKAYETACGGFKEVQL